MRTSLLTLMKNFPNFMTKFLIVLEIMFLLQVKLQEAFLMCKALDYSKTRAYDDQKGQVLEKI